MLKTVCHHGCAGLSRQSSKSHQQDWHQTISREGRLYLIFDGDTHLKPGSTVKGSDGYRSRSEGEHCLTMFGKARHFYVTVDLGACSHQSAVKRILVPEWILRLRFWPWLIDVKHEVCT